MIDMEIKVDPATSELLTALAASVKDLNIKATEVARQINIKIAANLAKLRESARKFETGLPGKLKILAMNGWFIYGFRTESRVIFPIASLFETGRIDEGNQTMCWHFNNVLHGIESDLIERFPKRALILKKAFAAHRAGDHELSIPVILAQADGIAHDTIGKGISNFSIYSKHKAKDAINKFVVEFAKEALLGSAILAVPLEDIPLNLSERNQLLIGQTFNRHAILHGRNTDYATDPHNSCRAISWLDYWSYLYFLKIGGKRKNYSHSGGAGGCGE
jgi:hypothetical protein